jgi:hypothetical protein
VSGTANAALTWRAAARVHPAPPASQSSRRSPVPAVSAHSSRAALMTGGLNAYRRWAPGAVAEVWSISSTTSADSKAVPA